MNAYDPDAFLQHVTEMTAALPPDRAITLTELERAMSWLGTPEDLQTISLWARHMRGWLTRAYPQHAVHLAKLWRKPELRRFTQALFPAPTEGYLTWAAEMDPSAIPGRGAAHTRRNRTRFSNWTWDDRRRIELTRHTERANVIIGRPLAGTTPVFCNNPEFGSVYLKCARELNRFEYMVTIDEHHAEHLYWLFETCFAYRSERELITHEARTECTVLRRRRQQTN